MSMELKDIAAFVSYNRPKAHITLKSIDINRYELVQPKYIPHKTMIYPMSPKEYERPSPENMFVKSIPNDLYQAFWSIQSSNGCDDVSFLLSSVLVDLNKKGFTLVHNGIKVVNIVAVNSTCFDISGLQEPTIYVPSHLLDNQQSEEIGLFFLFL